MLLLNRCQKMLLRNFEKFVKKEKLERTRLVKIMFLLKQEEKHSKDVLSFYSFYPHKFGPFSNKLYEDIDFLVGRGLINKEKNALTAEGQTIVVGSEKEPIDEEADALLLRFPEKEALMDHVYSTYPQYAIRSELAPSKHRKEGARGIVTVGYEGEDIDQFLNKLISNDVTILIDVRHNPFSMKPAFSKKRLSGSLQKTGIKYLHFPELGIPGKLRKNVSTSDDYAALFRTYEKEILSESIEKVSEIVRISASERVALMCFEKNIEMCHRGIISNKLRNLGHEVTDL